ncbi:uncharacterized protein LOC110023306 isoform X2 [Phalaenopsis equestris]|uniref:uncharacterized protein LOC110023306 isoform X2 n=1 Tax=Phalaenopsis equestris TaxID=78828 RepID=UPI0009E243E1|nr:uncharacterized protein LOC110023306 isoform X2 [Phalaenopsis equestris]
MFGLWTYSVHFHLEQSKMSWTQNNVFNSSVNLGTPTTRISRTCSLSQVTFVRMAVLCISPAQILQHRKMQNIVCSFPKCKSCAPTCLFGGKRNSRDENKGFSWDSLKDAFRGLRREKTVQDMFRDQMRQQEFGGDGNPPWSGGGGGSGGSGDMEDEGFAGILDETLQVVLATLAFIFVYIYIIKGAELTMLARDYIKYRLGSVPSLRLKRVMDRWKRALDKVSYMTEESDDWLIPSIVLTPTWWHRPEEIVRHMKKKKRAHRRN